MNSVDHVGPVCILDATCMCTVWILYVYTLYLHLMYAVFTLHVHCMRIVCTLYVQHMSDLCCMKIKIERMAPLGTVLINYHTVCTMSGSKVRMSLLQALKSLRVSDVKPYVVFVAAPNQQKLKDNITRTTGKEPTVSL